MRKYTCTSQCVGYPFIMFMGVHKCKTFIKQEKMLHHRIACIFQHRAAIYANYAYFQWFDSSLLKFQSLNLNLCVQAASYWIVTSIESLCLPKKVLPQILAFIQTPNTKNIPSIFGKYCSDMKKKRAEKWIQDIRPGHLCQYS